jgi:hypothetical protein
MMRGAVGRKALMLAMLPSIGLAAAVLAPVPAGWWSQPAARHGGILLLAMAGVAVLVFARRQARPAASAGQDDALSPEVPPQPAGIERRAHPRHVVDWAAQVAWRGAPAADGRLANVSHGGALLVGVPVQPAGSRGTLRIEGIALPVPFRVVGSRGEDRLHIAFELEGMGLDAFFAQLDGRVAGVRPAAPAD